MKKSRGRVFQYHSSAEREREGKERVLERVKESSAGQVFEVYHCRPNI